MMYTKEVQKAIKSVPKPPAVSDIRVAITSYPTNTLAVRVFEDQIMAYSESQRIEAYQYCSMLKAVIESFGFDSFIEGIHGKPRTR